jgi:hypothetical protein
VWDLIVRFLEHWNLRIGQLSRALTAGGRRGSTANLFPGPKIFLDEQIENVFLLVLRRMARRPFLPERRNIIGTCDVLELVYSVSSSNALRQEDEQGISRANANPFGLLRRPIVTLGPDQRYRRPVVRQSDLAVQLCARRSVAYRQGALVALV